MLSRKALAFLLSAAVWQTALQSPPKAFAETAAASGSQAYAAKDSKAASGQTAKQAAKAAAAQTKEQKAALELARQVVDAMGGLDKIKKFNATAYRIKGDYEQISSMSGSTNLLDFELTSKGLQQKSRITFMGKPVITCYDGTDCWTSHGNDVLPTDVVTARRVREDLDHGILMLERFLDKGRQITICANPRKVEGKETLAFSVIADDGKATTFYVDPQTHLVTRSEYQGTDMEQGVDCLKAYEYRNYRPLDGTMQPFKTVEYSGDKKVGVLKISDYTTKLELSDNFFAMPDLQKIDGLKQGAVTIPFLYFSNEILVKVSLNGQPEKMFLVDTGATQSIVDSEAARGLTTTAGDDISITTGSGSVKMKYADVKTMKLGDIVLTDVPVAITSLERFASVLQRRPAGLIGANVLKRFAITIDYDKQQLILQDPIKFQPPPNAVAVDSKPSLGTSGLAIEGIIDDKLPLTFLVDSGAAFNHVSESLIKNKFSDPILPVGSIKGLDGTPVKTGAVKFKSLKFGQLTVANPVFSVAPTLPSEAQSSGGIISGGAIAIVGNPLLSRYRVTIDYRNQRLFFELPEQRKLEDELIVKLEGTVGSYYQNGEKNVCSSALSALASEAQSKNQKAAQALAIAYEALISSGRADVPALLGQGGSRTVPTLSQQKSVRIQTGTGVTERLDFATARKFTSAYALAQDIQRKDVMAKILTLQALAESEDFDTESQKLAGDLLTQAMKLSPNEASAYSMLALLVRKQQATGTTGGTTQTPTGENITNRYANAIHGFLQTAPELFTKQALMLDPADWMGLWLRRSIALEQGKTDDARLIEKQLRRYYPDAHDVKSLPN